MSVRRTLLVALLSTMAVLLAGELAISWRTTVDAANSAYDRSLLGALKAIDANIRTDSGGLAVELPYQLFEFFELTASGPVYFRVATEDGLAVVGYSDLPPAPRPLREGEPQFYETIYGDEPLRVAAYTRALATPLYGTQTQRLILQIGESTHSRESYARELLYQTLWRDVVLLVLAAIGVVAAVVHAMRPLRRLRFEVAARNAEDVRPIALAGIPIEARPLIEAINTQLARVAQLTAQQREFLDDASHQLRTPLSILRTQLDFAAREADPQRQREALAAATPIVERATRLVQQLLVLARAHADAPIEQEPHQGRADIARALHRDFLALQAAAAQEVERPFHRAHHALCRRNARVTRAANSRRHTSDETRRLVDLGDVNRLSADVFGGDVQASQ